MKTDALIKIALTPRFFSHASEVAAAKALKYKKINKNFDGVTFSKIYNSTGITGSGKPIKMRKLTPRQAEKANKVSIYASSKQTKLRDQSNLFKSKSESMSRPDTRVLDEKIRQIDRKYNNSYSVPEIDKSWDSTQRIMNKR